MDLSDRLQNVAVLGAAGKMGSGISLLLARDLAMTKLAPENKDKVYRLALIDLNEGALDGLLEGRPPVISRTDAIVLLLLFGIFIYTNVLDFFQTRHKDSLLLEMGDYPLIATDSADPWRWPMAIGGMAMLFVGGQMTVSGS